MGLTEPAPQPETRRAHRGRQRGRRQRTVRWVLLGIAVLLIGTVAWVGVRGLLARAELEAAVPLAQQIQQQVIDGDTDGAAQTFETLDAHARAAESLTGDAIWRAYEVVPFLGPNLAVVRELASIVAEVSNEAIRPLTEIAGGIDLAALKPVDHTVALQPLIDLQPSVHSAAVALEGSYSRVDAIDQTAVLGVVRDATERLHAVVGTARDAVDAVDRAVTLIPAMLGADGPRNYLLLFQNPAEVRASGGLPGALALIHTEDGRIDLVQQASSADIAKYESPVLDLPLDTRSLYGNITGELIQDISLTPQFPITAALAREMWHRQYGVQVDGVISMDPIALAYILQATGPVILSTGEEINANNAVSLLLSEVYNRYVLASDQDEFFADAAAKVFSSVVGAGSGDPLLLVSAFAHAGEERRVLLWSAHKKEQALLASTTLAGNLPISDGDIQRFGVYQNEATSSKMNFYLTTEIKAGVEVCRNDGRATMALDITLTNTAPLDAATSLSPYVAGGAYGVPPGTISTIVYIYGPPGAGNEGATADFEGFGQLTTADSGYPVTTFQLTLAPGESKTVRSTMLSEQPFDGPIEVVSTPGINTHVTNGLLRIC